MGKRGMRRGSKLYEKQNNNVKQCRRCGHLFENNPDNFYYTLRHTKDGIGYHIPYNYCKGCSKRRARVLDRESRIDGKLTNTAVWYRKKKIQDTLGIEDYKTLKERFGGCEVCHNMKVADLVPIKNDLDVTTGIICKHCLNGWDYLCNDLDRLARLEWFVNRMRTVGGNIG